MRPLDDPEFTQRAMELSLEFNRYAIEHPEISDEIGSSKRVVLLVEGDEEYNAWATQLAKHHSETDGRPLAYLVIKKLRPVRSRIESMELALVQDE